MSDLSRINNEISDLIGRIDTTRRLLNEMQDELQQLYCRRQEIAREEGD